MGKNLSEMTLAELWELFPIVLTEHRECWKEWFAVEARRIAGALPSAEITHIGSTAVPGIWAKPIIDILVEIPLRISMETARERILELGYREMHQEAGRISFNKGYTEEGFAEKVFHLHLRRAGDRDEIFFRNWLRSHPEDAAAYEEMKKSLWKAYEHDRDGYTNAKTGFVREITARAKEEYTGEDS